MKNPNGNKKCSCGCSKDIGINPVTEVTTVGQDLQRVQKELKFHETKLNFYQKNVDEQKELTKQAKHSAEYVERVFDEAVQQQGNVEVIDARGNHHSLGERLNIININPTFEVTTETESASLGDELINNSGWIVPIGWTGDIVNGFKNTVGNTNPLEYTLPIATSTKLFQVVFEVESPTPAGVPNASTDFTVTLGNSTPFVTYQGGGNFKYSFGIQSVNSDNLRFIPGSTFDGTIKNVSVKEIIGVVKPSLQIENEGSSLLEVRTTKKELDNVFIGKQSGTKNTTGYGNTSLGVNSLSRNTTGYWNQSLGKDSLKHNTTGSRNVAIGYLSLEQNVSGDRNISIGTFSMQRNTHGRENISVGADTLWYNTTGSFNVGLGHYALGGNTTGDGNIAIGRVALNKNITGNYNVAIGNASLERSTTTQENIAIGRDTLKNTNASQLIAIGSGSQLSNTNAPSNVAVGTSTLRTNTTGVENTAIGHFAGYGTSGEIRRNVMVGNRSGYALTTGANDNVLIGNKSGDTITTGNGNIMIGSNTQPTASNSSNQLNIGNVFYGVLSLKRFGIGIPTPTARLHLLASDGTTGTAPLKIQSGTLLTNKEVGAIEFDGSNLYFTDNTGVRKQIAVL